MSLAENLITGKETEIKELKEIMHNATYNNIEKMQAKAMSFAGISEKNFLEGKRLALLANEGKDCSTYDYRAMGTSDVFPSSLTYDDGIWEFTLPLFSSIKLGKLGPGIQRYTGYLIKNLIEKYEENIGDITPLPCPVVVFEYGIEDETAFTKLYDADNRESKRALDSLTGKFFPDDNVTGVTTIHFGTYTDEPYTKIYIMETRIFLREMEHISTGKMCKSPLGRICKNEKIFPAQKNVEISGESDEVEPQKIEK